MSESKEKIEQAELLIRKGDYHEAAVILGDIVRADGTDGRAAFDLGNIALFTGEYDLACRYYKEADSSGYINYAVYLNMAVAQERMQGEKKTGSWKSIERLYLQAVRAAGEPQEQMLAASGQTLFYLRHGMMLKAEREAHRLIDRFPEQYQGHHRPEHGVCVEGQPVHQRGRRQEAFVLKPAHVEIQSEDQKARREVRLQPPAREVYVPGADGKHEQREKRRPVPRQPAHEREDRPERQAGHYELRQAYGPGLQPEERDEGQH